MFTPIHPILWLLSTVFFFIFNQQKNSLFLCIPTGYRCMGVQLFIKSHLKSLFYFSYSLSIQRYSNLVLQCVAKIITGGCHKHVPLSLSFFLSLSLCMCVALSPFLSVFGNDKGEEYSPSIIASSTYVKGEFL